MECGCFCLETAGFSVGAVYDRAYFVNSTKNARSAKREPDRAQPQE
jgi:hypothetical protein